MDIFDSPFYLTNKRLLYYFGQWPLQKPGERLFFRSTSMLLVGSIVVPKLIKLYECFGDFNGMTKCLPVLGLHAVSAAKFSNCWINTPKLKQLTCRIKDDWVMLDSDQDDAILRRYAERARILTLIYSVYLFVTLWMYLLLPAIPIFLDIIVPLNESRGFIHLYETEYFIDRDKYYSFLLLHAYITMPFSVGMIVAFDTMYAVHVHHVCGIFSILAQLASVSPKDVDESLIVEGYVEPREEEAYDRIVACIKIHKKAIEFANLLESATSACYFFSIGVCMLMITLTGFMTVTNLDEPSEALRFGGFAMGEIIHMYYVCWQGQLLIDHSEHIFFAAYEVDWCGMSIRAQKNLILIMMRSSVACKITAGKVYVLSLENFTAALKTSMSYFTVLLSAQ